MVPLAHKVGLDSSTTDRRRANNHQRFSIYNGVLLVLLVFSHDQSMAQHSTLPNPTIHAPVLGIVDLLLVVAEGIVQWQMVRQITALHH